MSVTLKICCFLYAYLDRFETQNRASSLSPAERSHMHDTLERLKGCRGRNCSIRRQLPQLGMSAALQPTAVNHVQRNNKRKQSKQLVSYFSNYEIIQ